MADLNGSIPAYVFCGPFLSEFLRIVKNALKFGARSLVVNDLCSETKGYQFEPGF